MRSVAPILPKYRAAKKAVQPTRKDGTKLSGIEALRAVAEAQSHLHEQPRDFHGLPKVPDDLFALRITVQKLSQSLNELGNLLSLEDLLNTPHKDLEEMVRRLASQRDVVCEPASDSGFGTSVCSGWHRQGNGPPWQGNPAGIR